MIHVSPKKERFLSLRHIQFVIKIVKASAFPGFFHLVALVFIPALPKSQLYILSSKNNVLGGIILSSLQLPYWANKKNRIGKRKGFFKKMKAEKRKYAAYAFVVPSQRRKGISKKIITAIKEPIFFTCQKKYLSKSMEKLDAKTSQIDNQNIPNLSNQGETFYQTLN